MSYHPCLTFTDELLETYPDAKVILTVRDSVDVWHESVMATIWPFVELLILKDVSIWRRLWRKFLDPDPFARMTELFHLNPEGMYHEFPTQGRGFKRSIMRRLEEWCRRRNCWSLMLSKVGDRCVSSWGVRSRSGSFRGLNERHVFVAHRVSFFSGLNWVVAKNVSKYAAGFGIIGLGVWYTLRRR